MEKTVPATRSIYEQALGSSWNDLHEAVRLLHGDGTVVYAAGTFRVRHGSNWIARLLAWLGGLPSAAEAVDLRLVITSTPGGEEWRRFFAGRPLVSLQWIQPDGLLVERMGAMELQFRLDAARGALLYHVQSVTLRLGPVRIPLLGLLAPRASASETPVAEGVHVVVEVRLPLLGLLVSYEGTVRPSCALPTS